MIYSSLSKDLSDIMLRLSQHKKEVLILICTMPIPACFYRSGRANFSESYHEPD